MLKYSNFAIVASFFGLWIDSFVPQAFQIYVGFLLIFSFGILHGANDLTLIKNINSQNKAASYWKILGYYIGIVLFGALLFYVLPALALLLFIIVSGYHFGEQHWNTKIEAAPILPKVLFETSYGMLLLFMLFEFHLLQVQLIIYDITGTQIPAMLIQNLFFLLLVSTIGLGLFIHFKYLANKESIFIELFYLIVFAVLFKVSSLIWGFALYFIFWHSIPSIIDQLKFLYGQASVKTFKQYFLSAALYWVISLIGITLLYFLFRDLKLFDALFFSFLASITFPHVLVIEKMFRKESNFRA
jgi:Brp/Blh family beta-carotene 15,15'-monooxygenase